MDDKILISDDINLANNFVGKVISWNDASDKKNVIDIPGYIAKNKEEIRATLLELTHQCAVFSLDNKSILEHLEIESDFSYWWFTTLGQLEPYSNGKSIYDLVDAAGTEIVSKPFQYTKLKREDVSSGVYIMDNATAVKKED